MASSCSLLCVLTLATIFSIDIATSSKGASHFASECREGTLFQSKCYKLSDETAPGYRTPSNCDKGVIRNEEENNFVKELIRKAGISYVWMERDRNSEYGNFDYYFSDSNDCFYMDKHGDWSSTSYCRTARRVLCISVPECQEGWIGRNCDRQCHCYKEKCKRDQYSCEYGCEVGWTGRGCFKEAAAPVVEHYCVKDGTHYSLVLSIDSSNVMEAGRLVPLDKDGKQMTSRNYSEGFNENGLLEISTKELHSSFEPIFHERKIAGSIFEWSFRLRQHEGLRMQSDVDFKVKCDFSDVDIMNTSTSLDFDKASFGKPPLSSPLPIEARPKIILKDPKDNTSLTDISIGQPVVVAMRQQDVDAGGSGEDGQSQPFLHMSPRACYAKSPDNVMVKQLTDEWGCELDDDYFGWFDVEKEEMFSEGFSAFGIPGYSGMNISCSLVPCFSGVRECETACRYRNYY